MDIEPSRSIYDALFSWGCLAAVVWDGVRIRQGPGSRNPNSGRRWIVQSQPGLAGSLTIFRIPPAELRFEPRSPSGTEGPNCTAQTQLSARIGVRLEET